MQNFSKISTLVNDDKFRLQDNKFRLQVKVRLQEEIFFPW